MKCVCVTTALMAAALICGCAPKGMEDGVAYYADRHHVRDAAARRIDGYWYLRADALILSDMDDAIAAGQASKTDEMRRLGTQTIRAAASLARETAAREIDRLPEEGRRKLAEKGGVPESGVKEAYASRVTAASDALVADLQGAGAAALLERLQRIRRAVEPLPDDKGRTARQTLFAWGALPAWRGVEKIEKKMESRPMQQSKKSMKTVMVMPSNERGDQTARFAPVIALDWPDNRDYPQDYDRFGEVYLTGDPKHIDVHVNTSKPTVYTYESQAKLNGKRFPQLVYVWWFPERPSMTRDDPVAGRIDGDTLRITFDSQNRPAVFEVVQGCGCGHLVYIAEHVEVAAQKEFGGTQSGKRLAVERDVQNKRDLVVSGAVKMAGSDCRPVVYVDAGFHSVSDLKCESSAPPSDAAVRTYTLENYDHLDRLPLGSGFGSMFGPDGLVHNAGRKEGYLLAPTGILSAGQPRKRGTQKIRWDDYAFEDPRLLEKALRLPSTF